MSGHGMWIGSRCEALRSGIHPLTGPTWDQRVLASVITCKACGEQWLVRPKEAP